MATPGPRPNLQACPRIQIVEGIVVDGAGAPPPNYLEVWCPFCDSRITQSCQGRIVATTAGPITELWYPAACPDCHHPLLTYTPPSPVARPHA